jgi:[glutamine synthetase] adenylyltransferase / [glutamine synthetase]-adenylyl-L-tyrosine phosphorylase
MADALSAEAPVRVTVRARDDGTFDVVVVGYDYFSELSILAGLFAAFGLDIRSGYIQTFGSAAARKGKIVDVFRVAVVAPARFDDARQRRLEEELRECVQLLARGRLEEASDRVRRRFVEEMEAAERRFAGALFPVEVHFPEERGGAWTVMDVRGPDTPGFLYALASALARRGVSIHRVELRTVGGQVEDRFHISDRQGRRIDAQHERERLRMAVALIKQFTHFLSGAPDPASAMRYFEQLLDRLLEGGAAGGPLSLFMERESLANLARLLGSSRFLWEDVLRMQFENLLPVLEHLRDLPLGDRPSFRRAITAAVRAAPTPEAEKRALNEVKDREMFLIDLEHLVNPAVDLIAFSRALTGLADAVLAEALDILGRRLRPRHGVPLLEDGRECPLALFGLGKFGGAEMGYGSDIELLVVYDGPGQTAGPERVENGEYFETLTRGLLDLVEARQDGIFQLDLRLRPHGRAGGLAVPVSALETYYRPGGGAAPFERQALVKLRFVAGDADLGRRVEAARDRFVYGSEPWDLAVATRLRGRQVAELVPPRNVNVKYSPGGVVDVEYTAQYLQILHGREQAALRTPTTLLALDGLRQAGILAQEEHAALREAYVFLRRLVDGLRMVRGNAKDLVLPAGDSDEFKFLARRLGYAEGEWERAAARLAADVGLHLGRVRAIFRIRFLAPGSPEFRRWS